MTNDATADPLQPSCPAYDFEVEVASVERRMPTATASAGAMREAGPVLERDRRCELWSNRADDLKAAHETP